MRRVRRWLVVFLRRRTHHSGLILGILILAHARRWALRILTCGLKCQPSPADPTPVTLRLFSERYVVRLVRCGGAFRGGSILGRPRVQGVISLYPEIFRRTANGPFMPLFAPFIRKELAPVLVLHRSVGSHVGKTDVWRVRFGQWRSAVVGSSSETDFCLRERMTRFYRFAFEIRAHARSRPWNFVLLRHRFVVERSSAISPHETPSRPINRVDGVVVCTVIFVASAARSGSGSSTLNV